MEISLISILKNAQKSVPAVKYAAGISGVAAVVAIVAGFQIDYRIAVFGTIIVLGLMFVLVIFSVLAAQAGSAIVTLSLFSAWSFTLLTITASLFLLTSYFFSWPKPLASYVPEPCKKISLSMGGYSTWQALPMPLSGKATYWWKGGHIVLGIWNDKAEKYEQHEEIKQNNQAVLVGQVGARNMLDTGSKADTRKGTVYMEECGNGK